MKATNVQEINVSVLYHGRRQPLALCPDIQNTCSEFLVLCLSAVYVFFVLLQELEEDLESRNVGREEASQFL